MKNKILSISFFVIIFSFFIMNIFIKDKDISYTERRKLNKFPKVTIKEIFNGDTFEKFDNYALDQFAFRDEFRGVKAFIQFNILNKMDNNGIFIEDNSIYKLEYPLKEEKVKLFISKMNNLYNNYLKDMNVYFAVIPDKNYYLNSKHLKMDYENLFNMVEKGIQNMNYIDITDCLTLDSYYRTDTHFKQDKLEKLVSKLANNMNFSYSYDYKINSYEPFYGVYYGQLALNIKPDTINYLTNDIINSAIVSDYDSDLKTIYEISSLGSMDSYDVFLSGSTPFITIENTKANTEKELVIFRDSFGSTLAPLLLEGYSKITLIDLRYMNSNNLNNFIKFDDQDILIIYSTLIINNSETIRD